MGYKTTSARFTQAKSAQSSDFAAFNNAGTGNPSISGTSLGVRGVITTVTPTPGANAASTTSATNIITVSNVIYTDSGYNTVAANAGATSNAYFRIIGTGFSQGSTIFLSNGIISNITANTTYISSTEFRANVPAIALGPYTVHVISSAGSVGMYYSSTLFEPYPTWSSSTLLYSGQPSSVSTNVYPLTSAVSSTLPITFALTAGNTLPAGLTLFSNGAIIGSFTQTQSLQSYFANIIVTNLYNESTTANITLTVNINDQFITQTSLIMNGEVTTSPGTTNNTIVDTGSSPLTITPSGAVSQGTFTPFSQNGWCNYFGTTANDYLLFPSASGFFISTGNFTVEGFFYANATTYGNTPYLFVQGTGATIDIAIQFSTTNILARIESTTIITYSGGWAANTWNHIALVRSGTGSNQVTLYLNGVSVGTGTSAAAIAQNAVSIGGYGSALTFTGYISNIRYNNTALYSGATYTVPTTRLTAVAGTVLLTAQASYFVDNSPASPNQVIPTVGGSVYVLPNEPFRPTAAYSTTTNGGSIFYGSGGSLSIPQQAVFTFAANFTLEAWVYWTASPSTGTNLWGCQVNGGLCLYYDGSLNPNIYNTGNVFTTTFSPVPGQWYHIALTRNAGTMTVWVNGKSVGSGAGGTYTASAFTLGNTGAFPQGYVANMRMVAGTAVYTTTFTPPTAPLAITGTTTFLLNGINGGILDQMSKTNLVSIGGVARQTTTVKYGTGAISFDGSTGYLYAPESGQWHRSLIFGSNDFTVETWVYMTTSTAQQMIAGQWSGSTGGTTLSWAIMTSNDANRYARFQLSTNGSAVLSDNVSTTSIALSTWTHIALNRTGSLFTLWVNGASAVTYTSSSALYAATNSVTIGATSTPNQFFSGNMDDFRITNGAGRYTVPFTPIQIFTPIV